MAEIPTAETFFLNNYFSDSISDDDKRLWLECNRQAKESVQIMIEFAKIHVEQALKSASKKSKSKEGRITDYKLTNSILNSYKLDNIK